MSFTEELSHRDATDDDLQDYYKSLSSMQETIALDTFLEEISPGGDVVDAVLQFAETLHGKLDEIGSAMTDEIKQFKNLADIPYAEGGLFVKRKSGSLFGNPHRNQQKDNFRQAIDLRITKFNDDFNRLKTALGELISFCRSVKSQRNFNDNTQQKSKDFWVEFSNKFMPIKEIMHDAMTGGDGMQLEKYSRWEITQDEKTRIKEKYIIMKGNIQQKLLQFSGEILGYDYNVINTFLKAQKKYAPNLGFGMVPDSVQDMIQGVQSLCNTTIESCDISNVPVTPQKQETTKISST